MSLASTLEVGVVTGVVVTVSEIWDGDFVGVSGIFSEMLCTDSANQKNRRSINQQL